MLQVLKKILARRLPVSLGRCPRCGSTAAKEEKVPESGFVSWVVDLTEAGDPR